MITNLNDRRSPSPELSARLLHASDITCCVCRRPGQAVQLHHLNGDRSDDTPDNFAVLCLNCHDRTQLRGGFGRHLGELVVRAYRDEWVRLVADRRHVLPAAGQPTAASGFSALRRPTGTELRTGRPCRVADATWRDLGVRASQLPTADADGLLPFLHRGAAQRALAEQMGHAVGQRDGMSILVIEGPAAAGKSRLAFEVLSKVGREDAWLLAPTARRPSQAAPSELGIAEACDPARHLEIGPTEPVVLWLDDVEELVGPSPWWIDAQALRRIGEDHAHRQVLVVVTAGGKGRRTVRDASESGYLDLLPELDRLLALAAPAQRIRLDYRALGHPEHADRFGVDAAQQIHAIGIGPYAVGREALRAAFVDRRWPDGTAPPGAPDALDEAVALAEGLLAWAFACAAGTTTEARARALWTAFRTRHDLAQPADDERWRLASATATTRLAYGYALVERPAGTDLLGVSDMLTPLARLENLMRHLFDRCRPQVDDADIDAIDVGARLARNAPDLAVPWLQELHDRGSPEASHLLGSLLADQGFEQDAVTYWEAAADGGVPAARFNLAILDLQADRLDAAQARFEQAVQDGLVDAEVRIGEIYERRDDTHAAAEHYRVAMDAGSGEGALRLGALLEIDDPQAALAAFTTAEQLGEPHGAERAAPVLERLGDLAAARLARGRAERAIYVEPVLRWLRDLPFGSTVRWSEASIGPSRPFGRGYLDVYLRGMGSQDMSLNWMLEVVEPSPDAQQGRERETTEIVLMPTDELRMQVLHANADDTPPRLIAASLWCREDELTVHLDVGEYDDEMVLAHELAGATRTDYADGEAIFVAPVWSCASITDAVAAWIAKHAGRTDLAVEWDRDGASSPYIQRILGGRRPDG